MTVTGIDDPVVDGDVGYKVITAAAVSTDSNYSGLNPADVSVTNTDDDVAGITVSPTSGLATTEAGGTDSFTVVLDTQPAAEVTIGISSDDTTEGTVGKASLTFTAGNWNVAQTVTVTGIDDPVVDGNVAYKVVTAAAVSTDSNYSGLNPADVSVTSTDDDVPAFSVSFLSPTSGTVAGGTVVTITGTGFELGASVTFGGSPATAVTVVGASTITATTPAYAAAGAVDVVVNNPGGPSGTMPGGYTYTAVGEGLKLFKGANCCLEASVFSWLETMCIFVWSDAEL